MACCCATPADAATPPSAREAKAPEMTCWAAGQVAAFVRWAQGKQNIHMSPAERAAAGSYVGCIAGAFSRAEYLDGLGAAAGFAEASVTFTNEEAPGMHSAIIRAVKPATA
jgi:hypothetical protein